MTPGGQSEPTPGQRPDPSLTPAKPFPSTLKQLSGASRHLQPRTADNQHLPLSSATAVLLLFLFALLWLFSQNGDVGERGPGRGRCQAAQHRRTGSLPAVPSGPSGPRGGPLSCPCRNLLLPLWGLHPRASQRCVSSEDSGSRTDIRGNLQVNSGGCKKEEGLARRPQAVEAGVMESP